MIEFVDVFLLILLAITGIAVIRMRNLFAAVMLAGIYSLLSAGLFVVMDAVDVAFTEAAVGAGISTVLFLGTLALVGYKESEEKYHQPILPLFVVVVTGAVLVYGTSDLPPFGNPDNPIHHHVADHYLEESEHEVGHIPNVVTSVLASYRGYDTMGEVAVIFTAMVGVLLLLVKGPLPSTVFHQGKAIAIAPGATREDVEAELAEQPKAAADGDAGSGDAPDESEGGAGDDDAGEGGRDG